VTTAEIERRKAVDDAHAYANRVLSTAKGDAQALINQGKTEANRMLQQVAAEARYFQDQLPNFLENRELFMARLKAEAISRILTNVQERVFALPGSPDGKPPELRLLINPPPRSRGPAQQPQQQ
jgi:regulator of protease activity HflC (stomatin/prohibitin superfamily)